MTVVHLTVNGAPTEVDVPGMRRLLDVLREDLTLTGTKEGCGEGECGACSVLVDGAVVDSCLVPICQVEGADVRTVEGLARRHLDRVTAVADPPRPDDLDVLQAAFLETGGAQCGICTPGMLMAGHAFLVSGAAPTDEAIREAIAGNLCRCTGYTKIVEAIALAAARLDAAAADETAPEAVESTGDAEVEDADGAEDGAEPEDGAEAEPAPEHDAGAEPAPEDDAEADDGAEGATG